VVAVHSGEKWRSNVLVSAHMVDLTLCRPVFPAHLQNISILLLLRQAPEHL